MQFSWGPVVKQSRDEYHLEPLREGIRWCSRGKRPLSYLLKVPPIPLRVCIPLLENAVPKPAADGSRLRANGVHVLVVPAVVPFGTMPVCRTFVGGHVDDSVFRQVPTRNVTLKLRYKTASTSHTRVQRGTTGKKDGCACADLILDELDTSEETLDMTRSASHIPASPSFFAS
jgi:hypothetical protein